MARAAEATKGTARRLGHFDARSVEEAVSLLSQNPGARIIAGGVDLVALMKSQVISPAALVNIKTVPGLAYIREDAQGLKIGPLTTIAQIARSETVRERYPLVAQAASVVGAAQVRNMGTLAGNLCQQVRCWYYRRSPVTGTSFFCRRKGGERCYAVAGENEHHAIFGDVCDAVCPSDLAPALVALQAVVRTAGPDGEREVPLEHFYTPMGNVLQPDEMITGIEVPAPSSNTRERFLKFRLRKAIDFAIASVAAAVTTESGVVTDARIVLGGVAPGPYRAVSAEEIITGQALSGSLAETAARAALSGASPLSKNAHKVPIAEALVKRALTR